MKIIGVARPVQRRRDGQRVHVYVADCYSSCVHFTAPTRSKLRKRLTDRGATSEMLADAGLSVQ